MGKEIKLSPPWITYYSELTKFFGNDPEVHHTLNEEDLMVVK